jgi:DNA polymerase III delta subunit
MVTGKNAAKGTASGGSRSSIKGIEFQRWIASRPPQGIYAFCGPEVHLRDEALDALKRRLAGGAGESAASRHAVESYQVGEAAVQEIAAAVSQGGLFGGDRLVLIDGIERLTRVKKETEREAWLLLARGPASNTVVMTSALTSRELSGRSTFLAALLGAIHVVEFWTLFPRDAMRWLIGRARQEGLELDGTAASYLVDHLGTDLGLLARELEKITLTAGDKHLGLADLKNLMRGGVLGSSWECVDALVRGDARVAIEQLQGVRREETSFSFAWKLTTAARNALTGSASGPAGAPGRSQGAWGSGSRGGFTGGDRVSASGGGADKGSLAALLLGCYYWERRVKQGRWVGTHDFVGLEALAAAHALRSASTRRQTGRANQVGPRGAPERR